MERKEDKILSSDTRKEILINLKQRNKTLSELSREIGVSKPAILKHLIFLNSSEAVKRIKNGNRFIYYRITEKGKRMTDLIISMIAAVFGSSIVHRLTAVKEEAKFIVGERVPEVVPEEAPAQAPKITEISTPEPVKDMISQEAARGGLPAEVILSFVLIFIAVFLIIRVLRGRK